MNELVLEAAIWVPEEVIIDLVLSLLGLKHCATEGAIDEVKVGLKRDAEFFEVFTLSTEL